MLITNRTWLEVHRVLQSLWKKIQILIALPCINKIYYFLDTWNQTTLLEEKIHGIKMNLEYKTHQTTSIRKLSVLHNLFPDSHYSERVDVKYIELTSIWDFFTIWKIWRKTSCSKFLNRNASKIKMVLNKRIMCNMIYLQDLASYNQKIDLWGPINVMLIPLGDSVFLINWEIYILYGRQLLPVAKVLPSRVP